MINTKPPNLTGRKAQGLYEQLARELNSGEFRVGDQFHTISEISERYSVSMATVVKCLSLLAKQGYLDQRQGSGNYVRDLPGNVARPHLMQKSSTAIPCLDYVMPEGISDRAGSEYLSEMLSQVPRHNNGSDHLALRLNLMPDRLQSPEEIKQWLQRLLESGAQAIVFRWMPRIALEIAVRCKWPVCVHGHPNAGIELPFVDFDQRQLGQCTAKHLIDIGAKRIGLLMRAEWRLGDNLMVNSLLEVLGDRIAAIETAPPVDSEVDLAVKRLLEHNSKIDALIVRNHPGSWLPRHAHELTSRGSEMPIVAEWKFHPGVRQIVAADITIFEAIGKLLGKMISGESDVSLSRELQVRIEDYR